MRPCQAGGGGSDRFYPCQGVQPTPASPHSSPSIPASLRPSPCPLPPPTCAGWAVEQHTPGRLNLEPLKQFWVDQRQEHHLFEGAHVVLQAAHLVKGHAGVNLLQA